MARRKRKCQHHLLLDFPDQEVGRRLIRTPGGMPYRAPVYRWRGRCKKCGQWLEGEYVLRRVGGEGATAYAPDAAEGAEP